VQYTTGKRDITGAEGRQQCSVFKHVALLWTEIRCKFKWRSKQF
jgi:hypothetical protein